jgi:NADH dehydrogenase (ubiquinone) 1 alpha subcomplex subunit 10
MAGVLRFSVIIGGIRSSKPLAKANIPAVIQACGISGKTLRGERKIVRPAPFPYKEKEYTFTQAWLDKTTKRFDENTKVILILIKFYF